MAEEVRDVKIVRVANQDYLLRCNHGNIPLREYKVCYDRLKKLGWKACNVKRNSTAAFCKSGKLHMSGTMWKADGSPTPPEMAVACTHAADLLDQIRNFCGEWGGEYVFLR